MQPRLKISTPRILPIPDFFLIQTSEVGDRSHLGLRREMNSQSPAALYSLNFQAHQPGNKHRKFSQGRNTLVPALAFRRKVFINTVPLW